VDRYPLLPVRCAGGGKALFDRSFIGDVDMVESRADRGCVFLAGLVVDVEDRDVQSRRGQGLGA